MLKQTFLMCLIVAQSYGAPKEDVQDKKISDLAADLENWMSLLPDDLRKAPINALAIPGTHNSFTNDITSKSEVSPDGEDILRQLQFLRMVKFVMANWAKNQALSVVQQLQTGIRFFDLRICSRNSADENLYFCHGMYSTDVRSVLTDLASYLDTHPKEVVILDCQHFYNFTSTTHAEAIQLLSDIFGDKLIPYNNSSISSLTLENLAAQNQQVLVVYRDTSRSRQGALWPRGSFRTPWYDTMDPDYLTTSLTSGITRRSTKVGYVSQLILTPSINVILWNVLCTSKQKCAVDFEDARTQWISNLTPGPGGVNVIIADFVELNDNTFSKTVINLNLKQLNSIGVFRSVIGFFVDPKRYIF